MKETEVGDEGRGGGVAARQSDKDTEREERVMLTCFTVCYSGVSC